LEPFLRWAGSKRQLVPSLRQFYPIGARYIEPFAGSACLFFALEPERGVLGDLNKELVDAFRAIRRDPNRVLEALLRIDSGKRSYYRLRRADPNVLADSEAAARFLFLNRYSFNGLYRTNSAGRFNVPYAAPKKRRVWDGTHLHDAAALLQRANLIHADFEMTLSYAEKGDFCYLDPPYVVSKRRVFSEYIPGSFSMSDLERLSESLNRLDRVGARFVISYADCSEARRILKHWRPRRVLVRRNISGFVSRRRGAYELLASNFEKSA
jgi:DNA adenine methylase